MINDVESRQLREECPRRCHDRISMRKAVYINKRTFENNLESMRAADLFPEVGECPRQVSLTVFRFN